MRGMSLPATTRPIRASEPNCEHGGACRTELYERMFVSMERQYELETLRRSIGMLQVGAPALDREKAMVLVRELQGMEEQLRRLRGGLQKLLDDGPD
jgi:hypothetical protein